MMATLCAGLPKIVFTYFAEVIEPNVFGIIPHLFDYLLYLTHTNMVSL